MIDLMQFCAAVDTGGLRISKPFSRGEFTYATNGHIAVRVPRRPDIPENDDAPNVAVVFDAAPMTTRFEVMRCELATETFSECSACNGTKREHECPSCKCPCAACYGKGEVSDDDQVSAEFFGTPIAGRYVRMMLALPKLVLSPPQEPEGPQPFEFEGGRGAVMPLRGASKWHAVAKVAEL